MHSKHTMKSGEYLNFVEIKKSESDDQKSSGKKKRTLLLMHGFGSGLVSNPRIKPTSRHLILTLPIYLYIKRECSLLTTMHYLMSSIG